MDINRLPREPNKRTPEHRRTFDDLSARPEQQDAEADREEQVDQGGAELEVVVDQVDEERGEHDVLDQQADAVAYDLLEDDLQALLVLLDD